MVFFSTAQINLLRGYGNQTHLGAWLPVAQEIDGLHDVTSALLEVEMKSGGEATPKLQTKKEIFDDALHSCQGKCVESTHLAQNL